MSEPAVSTEGEERRTEPAGMVVRAIAGLRQLVPALIALVFVLIDAGPWMLAAFPLALVVVGLSGLFSWLQWRRFTYRVGMEDIRVESGVLSRAARSVPYERIQDVSLEQGPLARLFGLVEERFEKRARYWRTPAESQAELEPAEL